MDEFEYKNKKIEFEESSDPKVSIDGEPTQVSHDAEANAFNAGSNNGCLVRLAQSTNQ